MRYAERYGQFINPSKSTIYSGSISLGRLNHLVDLLGFNIGDLPFNYLGCQSSKANLSHLTLNLL